MSVNFCHGSIRHTSKVCLVGILLKVYSGDADGMFLFWSQSHVQCNFCIVHKYQPITIYFCVGNDSASAISMRTIHLYILPTTYIHTIWVNILVNPTTTERQYCWDKTSHSPILGRWAMSCDEINGFFLVDDLPNGTCMHRLLF